MSGSHKRSWNEALPLWGGVITGVIYLLRSRGTLRSCHGTGVDFEKICVFCGKCCVCIDKSVFIVVKIKCMNFGRISDIYDKVNFTTNYTYFMTTDISYSHPLWSLHNLSLN